MRKILSIMLCALLLIGMFPLAVVAEELNTDAAVTVAASADGQNDVDDTVEEGITDAAEQEINEENDIALLAVEAGEENGYKYNLLIDSVTDEKYACIVSYTGTSADLTIPDSLGGYPVRMIGYEAFANNKVITGVVIPDSVTEIDTYAFSNCINLSSVKLSQNLKKIGGNVFYNCQALKAIEIPKSLTQTDIYYGGAFNSSGLETVTFEEGVTKIPAKLFNQCTSLKEITIPDTVTEIGEWAFSYCTNLSQVTLSKNLTFIFKPLS